MDTNMSRFGLQKTCVLKSFQLSFKAPCNCARLSHAPPANKQLFVSFWAQMARNFIAEIHLQTIFNSLILLCFVLGANGKSIERRGTQTTKTKALASPGVPLIFWMPLDLPFAPILAISLARRSHVLKANYSFAFY